MIPFNELDQALERHKQRQSNGAAQPIAPTGQHSAPNAGSKLLGDPSAEISLDEVEES